MASNRSAGESFFGSQTITIAVGFLLAALFVGLFATMVLVIRDARERGAIIETFQQ